jgi:histone H3/H4
MPNIDKLREKKTFKNSKVYCDDLFRNLSKEDFKSLMLRKEKFYKIFYEEYYPLSLYANLKFPTDNFFLQLSKCGSKHDAQILNGEHQIIEKIQITSSCFNYNNSLREEKLRRERSALGVGTFQRINNSKISQSRGLRNKASAISEVQEAIESSILKKLKNDTYENIEVLLVTSESVFSKYIENFFQTNAELYDSSTENKVENFLWPRRYRGLSHPVIKNIFCNG